MRNIARLILIASSLKIASCNSSQLAPTNSLDLQKKLPRISTGKTARQSLGNSVLQQEPQRISWQQSEVMTGTEKFHGETLILIGRDSYRQMGTTYFLEEPRSHRKIHTLPLFNNGISESSSANAVRSIYGEPNEISPDGYSWKYWVSGRP